jgi:hypothetical protein
MARFRDGGIELKCRRCKRTLVIPCWDIGWDGQFAGGDERS